jgi:hypothetical protein
MNNNGTQHLIEPFPAFLQWLSDKKVSAKIAAEGLILVFSYSTNKFAASRLMIPVVEGHKISPNIPKANILYPSNLALGLDFLAISNSSSRFHLRPPKLFFSLYKLI